MASRSTVITALLVAAGAAGAILVLAGRGLAGGDPGAQGLTPTRRPADIAAEAQDKLRQRGAYLMASMGCNDCHSAHDKTGNLVPGLELAGHPDGAPSPTWDWSMLEKGNMATISPTFTAFAGPFGTSYAVNLTPDKETGIGNMTQEQLIDSWRSGRHWKENRPVMPPMPIQAYASLTDDDIRALYAYLMSRPPVKNRVPASIPAPPPPGAGGPANRG
jgi:mono/diheme cytochrome c family protein